MIKVNIPMNKDYSYTILTGEEICNKIASETRQMKKEKIGIITDSNVMRLHANKLLQSLEKVGIKAEMFEIAPGEASKSIEEFKRINLEMLEKGFDRKSLLFAMGGGVVGDLTGFIASTYMRGIPYIQIPTTLLSMIDSSIGGKTAVNLGQIKNVLGTFKQPEKVYIDISFLSTLPKEEMQNGLVEAVKTGIIADGKLFDLIEKNLEEIFNNNRKILGEVIESCCKAKVKIVETDEKEQNVRCILNFGHSIGHALETFYNLSHGKAVAIGLVLESRIALRKGFISEDEQKRIETLVKNIGFDLLDNIKTVEILEKMRKDKKNIGGKIKIPLPDSIGNMHSINGAYAIQIDGEEISEILGGK